MSNKVIKTKGSEDTFRTELYKILEKNLPKKYTILNSIHLQYLDINGNAIRREFDGVILLKEDVYYRKNQIIIPGNSEIIAVIETKSPESGVAGIKQAAEGSIFLDSEFFFATNFKELYYTTEEGLQSINFKGKSNENISEIAKIIENTIRDSEKIEIDKVKIISNKIVIKILRQCMEFIENELAVVDPKILETKTGFLWARKLDAKTYKSEKKSEELTHDARKAASYLVLDQIIFYLILSSNIEKYEKLTTITSFDEIRIKFKTVLKDDYSSIFGVDILSFLPENKKTIETVNQVIKTINRIPFSSFELDILGKIFHGLIPLKIRKPIAAYYTKNQAAIFLAKLSIENWDDKVFDLACGSGTLLTAAYFIKKRLIQTKYTTETHRELIDQIFGNDVSIFAAHLATINLAIQNPLAFTNKVNITVGDGFSLTTSSRVLPLRGISPKKFDLNGKSTEPIKIGKFEIVFMNPPFTRHERMDPDQKKFTLRVMGHNLFKKYVDKKMGYNAYFILHAHIFLETRGRLALVLPASTFYADYGQKIKQFLIEKRYSINYLIELEGERDTSFSEDCDYKELLFVAQKGTLNENSKAKLITLFKIPDIEECIKICEEIQKINSNLEKEGAYRVKIISQLELLNEKNWLNLFKEKEESSFDEILKNTDLLEKIKDNNEIILSAGFHGTYIRALSIPNKYWGIEKDLGDHGVKIFFKEDKSVTVTIPKSFILPSFRKPELYQKIYEDPTHFVINLKKNDEIPLVLGKNYLNFFKVKIQKEIEDQINKGKMRNPLALDWYTESNRSGCEKTISKIWIIWKLRIEKRKSFAFLSSIKTTAHHAFYRIILPNPDLNELMVSWMNTSFWVFQLFLNGRTVAKGLIQLMINDMKEIFIPKLNKIDESSKLELLRKTRVLRNIQLDTFPNQLKKEYRTDLDRTWLKALKIPEEKIDEFLKKLYDYLTEKINKR